MLNFFGSTEQLPNEFHQSDSILLNESQIAIEIINLKKVEKMPTQIITTDDLREFKIELLEDIKALIQVKPITGVKKYLKSGEIMEMLQVSPGTLQNLRINGTLPYTKIGGIIFYDAVEIENVMKENRLHHKF